MVRHRMIKNLGISVIFLGLMAACGDISGSGQCGGAEATGSCLRVEKIVPKYDGTNTPSVDAFQDICNINEVNNATTTPVAPTFEKFKDHSVELTLSNRPLRDLKKEDISDITLTQYAIVYTLNQCLNGATCPDIPTQVVDKQTIFVPAEGTFTGDLPFVPLAAKFAFDKAGGSKFGYPSYTATYTFRGTDTFGNPVSVVGSAEFTIGNFKNCS